MIPAPCCHEVIYNNTDNAGDSCSGSKDVYNDRLPYCDQDNSDACFDSKDYDQETGLYPCMGTDHKLETTEIVQIVKAIMMTKIQQLKTTSYKMEDVREKTTQTMDAEVKALTV
jgi:hypothetical protein